jgi:hypothetical protein
MTIAGARSPPIASKAITPGFGVFKEALIVIKVSQLKSWQEAKG